MGQRCSTLTLLAWTALCEHKATTQNVTKDRAEVGGSQRKRLSMIVRDGIRVFSMSAFARTICSYFLSQSEQTHVGIKRGTRRGTRELIVAKNRRMLGHTMGATPWPPAVQRLGDVFVGSLILVAPLWIGWQLHDGGGGGGELPSWVGDVGPAAHQWWDQWATMVRGNSVASSHHHCCCSHAVLHSMCLLRCSRGAREQTYVRGGVSIELLAMVPWWLSTVLLDSTPLHVPPPPSPPSCMSACVPRPSMHTHPSYSCSAHCPTCGCMFNGTVTSPCTRWPQCIAARASPWLTVLLIR